MFCPNPLDLTNAASGELRRALDALAGLAQCDDPFMNVRIRLSTAIFTCRFGEVNALLLPFALRLVIIPRHLKGQFQKHFLYRFEDNLCHTVRFGRQVGKIDDAGYRQPRAFGANRRNQPFRIFCLLLNYTTLSLFNFVLQVLHIHKYPPMYLQRIYTHDYPPVQDCRQLNHYWQQEASDYLRPRISTDNSRPY